MKSYSFSFRHVLGVYVRSVTLSSLVVQLWHCNRNIFSALTQAINIKSPTTNGPQKCSLEESRSVGSMNTPNTHCGQNYKHSTVCILINHSSVIIKTKLERRAEIGFEGRKDNTHSSAFSRLWVTQLVDVKAVDDCYAMDEIREQRTSVHYSWPPCDI